MKKKIYIGIIIIVFSFMLFNIVQAVGGVPGSSEDPLVTESFLNSKLASISASIKELKTAMTNLDDKVNKVGETSGGSNGSYESVPVSAGETLIGEAGCEIILRAGNVRAIAPVASLSDVTSGNDVKNDERLVKNHLVIIPRADGRGVSAESNAVLMVRGGYTIK